MRLLVVEDEPRISDGIKSALDGRRVCLRYRRRRRGCLVPRRHGSLRSGRARSRPAEARRSVGAEALARRGPQHAGAGADGARHLAGARRRHRRRRRRLSRQAVPHRGIARPRARPHPPLGRPEQRRSSKRATLSLDTRQMRISRGGDAVHALAARIPAHRLSHASQGARRAAARAASSISTAMTTRATPTRSKR